MSDLRQKRKVLLKKLKTLELEIWEEENAEMMKSLAEMAKTFEQIEKLGGRAPEFSHNIKGLLSCEKFKPISKELSFYWWCEHRGIHIKYGGHNEGYGSRGDGNGYIMEWAILDKTLKKEKKDDEIDT